MFWKKDKNALPGPKGVPDPVGREIVQNLGGNPDKVWNLKAVIRPKEGEKDTFEVRVFNGEQASSKHVSIKNYDSLDEYPDLILYEGWFNKKAEAKIEKKM
jgi:hypothetical protein